MGLPSPQVNKTMKCDSAITWVNILFISGNKYKIHQRADKLSTEVTLTILNLKAKDFGTYLCVAKNSLGKQDGTIKLSGNDRHKEHILRQTLHVQ